ncbi:hypothetical protein WMY93_006730 [Mugilogobius chulae]|uniref:Uncharacterized protein n=1 Tax=Mugilogobius chulae TaxID=88201 RepID=A0AAW0PKZ5_9GOBI
MLFLRARIKETKMVYGLVALRFSPVDERLVTAPRFKPDARFIRLWSSPAQQRNSGDNRDENKRRRPRGAVLSHITAGTETPETQTHTQGQRRPAEVSLIKLEAPEASEQQRSSKLHFPQSFTSTERPKGERLKGERLKGHVTLNEPRQNHVKVKNTKRNEKNVSFQSNSTLPPGPGHSRRLTRLRSVQTRPRSAHTPADAPELHTPTPAAAASRERGAVRRRREAPSAAAAPEAEPVQTESSPGPGPGLKPAPGPAPAPAPAPEPAPDPEPGACAVEAADPEAAVSGPQKHVLNPGRAAVSALPPVLQLHFSAEAPGFNGFNPVKSGAAREDIRVSCQRKGS